MTLCSVEVQRTAAGSEVKAIHATCDVCGDGRELQYVPGDGPGFFLAIKNTAESELESGYRVMCPAGHREGFSVAQIYGEER
jgi:hypothetical protein